MQIKRYCSYTNTGDCVPNEVQKVNSVNEGSYSLPLSPQVWQSISLWFNLIFWQSVQVSHLPRRYQALRKSHRPAPSRCARSLTRGLQEPNVRVHERHQASNLWLVDYYSNLWSVGPKCHLLWPFWLYSVFVQGDHDGLTSGFVDFDLFSSSVCPILLGLVNIGQRWHGKHWLNSLIEVNEN